MYFKQLEPIEHILSEFCQSPCKQTKTSTHFISNREQNIVKLNNIYRFRGNSRIFMKFRSLTDEQIKRQIARGTGGAFDVGKC